MIIISPCYVVVVNWCGSCEVVCISSTTFVSATPKPTNPLKKLLLELFSENDVDKDIHRRVESYLDQGEKNSEHVNLGFFPVYSQS